MNYKFKYLEVFFLAVYIYTICLYIFVSFVYANTAILMILIMRKQMGKQRESGGKVWLGSYVT